MSKYGHVRRGGGIISILIKNEVSGVRYTFNINMLET